MGIRGSMAGTALSKTYKRLSDPKVRDHMKQTFGVDAVDAAGNLRDVATVLGEIGKAISGLGNAEQIADPMGIQSLKRPRFQGLIFSPFYRGRRGRRGNAIEKATFALFEALADFFPSRQGDILRKILLLAKEQQEKAAKELEKALQETSGTLSTASQESSEPTPAP